MSTDDSRTPPGEPPRDEDPLAERPGPPGLSHANGSPGADPGRGHDRARAAGPPPGSGPGGGEPQGGGGAHGGAGEPYGGGPYGGPYGGGPFGGPGSDNPYGGPYGAADPLAGMPPLANRGRRLVARIIDALIIGVPIGLIMSFALNIHYTASDGDFVVGRDTGKQSLVQLVTLVVYLVYEALMLAYRGQTVGKMLMRIRVAMLDDGSVPSGPAAWIRAAVYSLPEVVPCCGAIFWLVNVLWCTWDRPYHQCLHDKAAKTVVVSTRQPSTPY
ncbi:RDD family protein [Streptomyces sp. NPDC059740]|uniref:RDD family protein n=1 Tax=Streptomyces sp. NPDC059740 TaxID=3346926 RepID=UPI00364A18DA